MRNLLLSSTIVAVAALAATACSNPEPTADAAAAPVERRVDVPAITVGTADLESTLEISGSLMPQARVAVMPKLPGMLSTISVDLGDRVRAGQVVATLDRREIDAQVDAAAAAVGVARAGIESAEAALANAVLEHDRARNLFEKGAVARQRLDAAETARRASSAQRDLANANLNQVEAALRRARELQRDATITSPIEGVVVERNFDAGSLVGPGDKPIVIVADLRIMTLEAGVSELEAGRLRAGMPARVTAQAKPGEVYEGRLAAVAPEVDARNRHFAIEVRTPNPGGALLSGMYATATIPIERAAQAVAVPREAVTSRDGARVVLKIDNNTVQAVPVTEGLISGGLVQITSGLRAGDVIVSDARREVAGGVTVNPVFAK
jgi:HlyD family secretion protein